MGSKRPLKSLDLTRVAELPPAVREPWTFLETTPPVGEALLTTLRENA